MKASSCSRSVGERRTDCLTRLSVRPDRSCGVSKKLPATLGTAGWAGTDLLAARRAGFAAAQDWPFRPDPSVADRVQGCSRLDALASGGLRGCYSALNRAVSSRSGPARCRTRPLSRRSGAARNPTSWLLCTLRTCLAAQRSRFWAGRDLLALDAAASAQPADLRVSPAWGPPSSPGPTFPISAGARRCSPRRVSPALLRARLRSGLTAGVLTVMHCVGLECSGRPD